MPGAKHEVIMETDEKRAVFLSEFDALADYLAPMQEAASAAAEVVVEDVLTV